MQPRLDLNSASHCLTNNGLEVQIFLPPFPSPQVLGFRCEPPPLAPRVSILLKAHRNMPTPGRWTLTPGHTTGFTQMPMVTLQLSPETGVRTIPESALAPMWINGCGGALPSAVCSWP